MKHEIYIMTFISTHHAIRFERGFAGKGIDFELIPVPRKISSSCGLAAKLFSADAEKITSVCRASGICFEAIYRLPETATQPAELICTFYP